MIYPDTELRPVDPRVGMGVVATTGIPKGTITWVRDELDQTFSQRQALASCTNCFGQLFTNTPIVSGTGEYVLCWDHGRFINHSCDPNCMAPGFDFEIAIRDIEPGEQLTGDYATYNLETGFQVLLRRERLPRPDRAGGSSEARRRVGRLSARRVPAAQDGGSAIVAARARESRG